MALDKAKNWLDLMNLKYQVLNNNIVLLYDIEGIRFAVNINSIGSWIQIAALIVHIDDVPKEKREELLIDLLKQNWELNDVTYSLNPKGSIFSENDILVDSNYENFKSEFGAVVYGVTHFFSKIGPKYGLTKPSDELWIGKKD